MSATSGGGGSVSEGSETGGSSQSTMSAGDSPSTSFQNNLAENVTKITLSEDNGVDVTGSKINLTLDERQQKDGIANVAFDYEDETNRGGDFKSINSSEQKDKVPEAVNLELVNMVPYSNGNGTSYGVPVNGIPMKKDSEQVDMSTPYDEYFVPVNEHKKYMRGEKLYVTKDKRRPTSWRKCLSWIVACTVISVVLIVAILAGTGVILSQDQNYIKEASVGRNFAGSNLEPSVTDKSISPTAEMYMYVPRSIESEFVIDNLDYDPAFKDVSSPAYQQFASTMEDQLKTLLFDKESLEFGASNIGLKVVNISRDPFKVNYRIGWNYKQGVNNPPEPIKMEDVKKRLVESLARNQGYIDKYHIDREAIKVNHVINSCQIDNGGCSHICYYNYITQEFTCTCPTHLVLDSSGKNCVAWTGPSEDDAVPVPSRPGYPEMPFESTANPAHAYESGVHYDHGTHHHFANHPEDHSESSFESGHGHEHTDNKPEAEPKPEPEPEPEPAPEPTPEPGLSTNSETNYGHDNTHSIHEVDDHDTYSEPTPEPNVEDKYHSHVHSVDESKEPITEQTPEPEGGDHDHSVYRLKEHEPSAEPTPEPEPSSESDSEGRSHNKADHSVYVFKNHESEAEPTAEPIPEPTAEPNADEKTHGHSDHYDSKNHEPAAEPTPEPAPEPEPEPSPAENSEKDGVFVRKNHESSDSGDHDHSVYEHKEQEPTAEPASSSEPAEVENKDKKVHDLGHSLFGSEGNEPSAEPTSEPAPEPSTNDNSGSTTHEHIEHSVYEVKDNEPTAEPTPETNMKDVHDSINHGLLGSKNQEETAEPTPEPAPESTNNDQSTHFVYETKDKEISSETTQKPEPESFLTHEHVNKQSIPEVKIETDTESSPEPTPEPLPENDSSNLKDTTKEPHEAIKSDYDSSEKPNPQMKTTEDDSGSATEHPPEAHSTESDQNNKSEQKVPYLKDILIANPSLNSGSQNATHHNHNLLDDVERTSNGKPVIEEIIIEKSDRKSEGHSRINPSHPLTQEHTTNDSDSNSKNVDDSAGHTEANHLDESSTTGPVLRIEPQSDLHNQGVQLEVSTDHPKTEHSTQGIENSHHEQTQNVGESTSGSGSSQFFNSGIEIAENKTGNPLNDNLSVTTVKTDIQPEYQTIPVSVELLDAQSKLNDEEKLKKENQTEMHDSRPKEGPTTELHDSVDSTNVDQSHQESTHEIPTEPPISMTTLPSILIPREVQKINDQIPDNEDERKIQIENKVNQTESNETKSPEEISNNIKDELLDNEEFNTLIDKEIVPGEGKDVINKYPNKSLKTEKKKLKDYIKGEKIDSDKKLETTSKAGAIPEDFIFQKHANGNEHTFDLDYSLQNEHTTKHDGGVTVIDPHGIEGVPGVSFKPHGINNHDISVLQTVAPDFKTEAVFPGGVHELEASKSDFKNKQPDMKDLESKLDKEYKFDKDYKYEKQKVSKKKDLKKKVGGKDGKNVELDEGRKFYTKDDWDVSQEAETTMNPLEKLPVQPEIDVKVASGPPLEITTIPESYKVSSDGGSETTLKPIAGVFEVRTKVPEDGITEELSDVNKSKMPELATSEPNIHFHNSDSPVDKNGHLMIDEPSVKSAFNESPGTVYDNPEVKHEIGSVSLPPNEHGNSSTPGTVFDGIPQDTITKGVKDTNEQNVTFGIFENTPSIPQIFAGGNIVKSSTADPTIIINGQSGNLQNGHVVRFANSTFHNPNVTVMSIFNKTLTHLDDPSFSFMNYTATFPNGTMVQPTIVVHGQSGALQGGHEIKFGNSSFLTTSQQTGNKVFTNSNVYRIENGSLPGTVFDGHFNPRDGHYHMFTNASGTFVYSNTSVPPAFVIAGQSGDFGNSTAYIIGNNTRRKLSDGFSVPHSVIFRNSTVFAVENIDPLKVPKTLVQPNETIHFTHQMSPSFVSSGTAYEVNDYFGYISKCAAGQFQCLNGTSKRGSSCISLSSKCDSINDCSDGSDEMGCIENGCPGNFQCSDNTCLKRNLVCNGILDCSDGSDEKNCESWKCEFDEFQCPSGRCIPVVWQCDSKPDCDNHTDEYNCQTSCGNDEYLCPEGWCIPLTYKCNGIKECSNGEDEQLCDCSHEEFKCQTGGCVSLNQVCNGLDDCPDRSDEWDCVKLESDSNLLKIRSSSGDFEPVCADNWSPKYSDEVCASLGYFSSIPIESKNSSITTETSFYKLKNDTTVDFNRKIIVNLEKSEGDCSSGKLVEITCQEFSCGSRSMTDSSSVEARLVGGMSAAAGQWPSVALIYNIRNFHSCTANVLTPRWVLASYNCLKMGNKNLNEQDWQFFGGSIVFEAEKDNAETRKILSIIPHPQVKFNQFLFSNDLALVELQQSLQFTSNLGAVCLPEQEIQPRQICVTAGWGMNTPEDKTIRQQLQYLPVPTMNLTECNSTEHYSGFITEDKICAGYNSAQKSLCYNEEGAPLMCVNDRGEWELQGVLSYHSNCGRGSHPSIFSSITPVKNWIKKTIRNNFERKTSAATKR